MKFITIFIYYFISAFATAIASVVFLKFMENFNPSIGVEEVDALLLLLVYSFIASIIGSVILYFVAKSFLAIIIYRVLMVVLGSLFIILILLGAWLIPCEGFGCIGNGLFLVIGTVGSIFSFGGLVSLVILRSGGEFRH